MRESVHNTVNEIKQRVHTFPGILLKLRNPARQRRWWSLLLKTQNLQVTLPVPCAHSPPRAPGQGCACGCQVPGPRRGLHHSPGASQSRPISRPYRGASSPRTWHSASLGLSVSQQRGGSSLSDSPRRVDMFLLHRLPLCYPFSLFQESPPFNPRGKSKSEF